VLASQRFASFTFLLVAFSLAPLLPVAAQVHGLAPSVTSPGFGGNDAAPRGLAPSVTSLGPSDFTLTRNFWGNCCVNYFGNSDFGQRGVRPPLRPDRYRRHHRDNLTYVPLAVPTYIPYGVSYAADGDEDGPYDSDDAEYFPYESVRAEKHSAVIKRPPPRILGKTQNDEDEAAPRTAAPETVEEPVAAQPSTVLVYKDGHRSDVVNYAIVGDTLFDFAEGRTHKILLADLDLPATEKANDERGVEFKVPPAAK
jgi:hypothetical protein